MCVCVCVSSLSVLVSCRFSLDHSQALFTEYFTDSLKDIGRTMSGLSCTDTPLGLAIIADTASISEYSDYRVS